MNYRNSINRIDRNFSVDIRSRRLPVKDFEVSITKTTIENQGERIGELINDDRLHRRVAAENGSDSRVCESSRRDGGQRVQSIE